MLSAKLVLILKTFSPVEWKKFEKYIQSPFFNTNPRLVTLVQLLRKAAPDFEHPSLKREALFIRFYGKEKVYNEQQVYDHISFLIRHLENFMAYNTWVEDKPNHQLMLLRALNQKDLNERFEKVFKKGLSDLEKGKIKNVAYQIDKFLWLKEDCHYKLNKPKLSIGNSLSKMLEQLDLQFLISKLKYSCEMFNQRNVLNVSYEPKFLQEIQQFLEKEDNPYTDHPVLALYYQIFLMFTQEEDEVHYHKVVKLLDEYSHLFPKNEAEDLYTYVLNYCAIKFNSGEKAFIKELFVLNKKLLEKEILPLNGELDHRKYKNMVSIGLILKEYDWVKSFLEDYKEFVTEEVREAAYNYNMANYYFSQKEYRKALRTLQFLEIDDVFYHLSVKKILLKTYYELQEEDSLESLISTFYAYIKRNKTISKSNFEAYRNLLRFVRKAEKLRQKQLIMDNETFAKQAQALLDQIDAAANLPDSWIRSKVSEMVRVVGDAG